jgi:hypothetical protein
MGFPRPHVDDPYFAGTASWLAQGYGLRNPWIANWLSYYGSAILFQHIPFYFYLLAGWYQIAGISTDSTLLFYALINVITALSAAAVLRRVGFPSWAIWMHLAWLVFFAQGSGFRCDMVCLAFFWTGALLFLSENTLPFTCGCFLLGVAVSVWPPLSPFALAFGLGWVAQKGSGRDRWNCLRRCLYAGLFTGVIGLLVIHGMIGGDWSGFVEQYLKAAASRRPDWDLLVLTFIGLAVSRYSWCLLLALILMATSLLLTFWYQKSKKTVPCPLLLWSLCAGCGAVGLALLYPYAVSLAFYFVPIVWLAALWADALKQRGARLFFAVLFTALCLPQVYIFTRDLFSFSVNIPPGLRESVERQRVGAKRIVFDEYAYRLIFNMNPPQNSVAWFYLESGMFAPGASFCKEGDLWVVAESCLSGDLVNAHGSRLVIYPEWLDLGRKHDLNPPIR